MSEEIFDIVNDRDEVTGTVPRSEAHKKGLQHRAVHVLFITPDKNLILQRRSMTKDTYPGYLTVTVGGHVPSGGSYDETVLTEIAEETGLRLKLSDLTPIAKLRYEARDPTTGAHDCELVTVYGHVFKGKASDLKIEAHDGAGFEVYSVDKLLDLTKEERAKEKIVPMLFSPKFYAPLYEKFLDLVS